MLSRKASDQLVVQVPSAAQDRPAWRMVGIIAAVGLVAGIVWPRLAGVRLGPSLPEASSAVSTTAPPQETTPPAPTPSAHSAAAAATSAPPPTLLAAHSAASAPASSSPLVTPPVASTVHNSEHTAPVQTASVAHSNEPPADGTAQVVWETALVRDAPKTGKIVARLPRGTTIRVGAVKDGWYPVKPGNGYTGEGWVFRGAIGR